MLFWVSPFQNQKKKAKLKNVITKQIPIRKTICTKEKQIGYRRKNGKIEVRTRHRSSFLIPSLENALRGKKKCGNKYQYLYEWIKYFDSNIEARIYENKLKDLWKKEYTKKRCKKKYRI